MAGYGEGQLDGSYSLESYETRAARVYGAAFLTTHVVDSVTAQTTDAERMQALEVAEHLFRTLNAFTEWAVGPYPLPEGNQEQGWLSS